MILEDLASVLQDTWQDLTKDLIKSCQDHGEIFERSQTRSCNLSMNFDQGLDENPSK